MIEILAAMMERISRLESRLANMAHHGPVHEVDAKNQTARIRLGGTDDEPYLSPWVPYAQQAGAFKGHVPVTKGQNMTLFSPSGIPEQAVALPFTFNNDHKSPSEKSDENVFTYGNMKAEVRGNDVKLTVGGTVISITGDKVSIKTGAIETTSGTVAFKKG